MRIVAQLVTADGMNVRSYFSHAPEHMWSPIRHTSWVIPSAEVRSVQASEIPLRAYHGGEPIGRIVHLERRATDGSLWCVAHLDHEIQLANPDEDTYLSVEATYDEGTIGTNIQIRGAAICAKSCMIGLHPATLIRDNGLDTHGRATWRLGEFQQSLLKKADATRWNRRASDPIIVHEAAPANVQASVHFAQPMHMGPLEIRSAATQLAVSGRTIEMIVMPYETPTVVVHHGQAITEIVTRTAFNDVEKRTHRVRVNRDHDLKRTVGRAIAFDTQDPRGLLGEFHIARTTLGDETLALAEDGCLDASAGFMVRPGGDSWENNRTRRRLNRLLLDHVALTPDPAYETANVLAVRNVARAATFALALTR